MKKLKALERFENLVESNIEKTAHILKEELQTEKGVVNTAIVLSSLSLDVSRKVHSAFTNDERTLLIKTIPHISTIEKSVLRRIVKSIEEKLKK